MEPRQAGQSRVALVTGANRGIGQAIARALVARGLHVVAGVRRAVDGPPAVSAAGAADWVAVDVADPASRAAAVTTVLERHGRCDVLVNNAGVALDKWVRVQDLDPEVLRATLETNLHGPLDLCQRLLPAMRAQGYGRIVNLSSELGSIGESRIGGSAAYRISKTALNMLTRLLALELADTPGILVNAAAPGWVRTELGGDDAPRSPEEGARTPVWLATLPEGGASGGFFRDEAPYPW